jgi:hypothetical protein
LSVPRLFVTTSGGVVVCNPHSGLVEQVVPVGDRRWTGFFGITRHDATGRILAACRQRLGTQRVRKHSTDVLLYSIDPETLEHETVAEIYNVHDVHQIEAWEDLVFLTDTGLNRLHVLDLDVGEVRWIVEIGEERDDVNHLNALLVQDTVLLAGMNNRGHQDAAIMSIPLATFREGTEGVIDGYAVASLESLPGQQHTHDLEPWTEGLLTCASHDGLVLRTDPPGVLFPVGGWSRGLAVEKDGIWVGISQFAERGRRHSRRLAGEVVLFDHQTYEPVQRITIKRAGQVHDLILA